jgi:hypothetical protein
MSSKLILALAATAALLAGCATDPYYDNYNYASDDGYYYGRPAYPSYGYGPAYYPPHYYSGPRIGFGIGYSSGWRYR